MTLAPPEKTMQPASAVAESDAVALADLTAVGNFRKIYTSAPAGGGVYLARAPGRVEILGNHTDYNDGFVLSAGVQMQCRVVGGIGRESTKVGRLRVYSAAFPDSGVAECSFADVLASSGGDSFRALKLPPYCVYVCGVIVEFSKQFGGKLNLLSHQTSSSHDRDTSFPSQQAPGRPHPDPNSTSLDLYIESEVPLGAAVSSSAALEVATAMLLQEMFVPDKQHLLPDLDLILLCKRAENNYVGMGCGILDQFSSHQAERERLLVLDCRYPMENLVKLPMGGSSSSGSFVFVIANTGVKHALVDGQYDNLKRLCYEARDDLLAAAIRGDAGGEGNGETDKGDEGGRKIVQHLRDVSVEQFERYKREIRSDEARNRGEHVVYENQRVQEACGKLLLRLAAGESSSSGDRPEATAPDVVEMNLATILGPRMTASHKSSRDLFGNSCPELDQMVALALEAPGCFGSRLMGGGFGGCTISLVEEAKVNEFSAELGAKYKIWLAGVVGGKEKDVGVEGIPAIHVVRPGDGAFVKKLRPEELAEADRAAGGGGDAETCAVL